MIQLEQRTLDRIAAEYSPAEQQSVAEILDSYHGPERARVIRDILDLSKGDTQKLLEYVRTALIDYRDVLYWAEYFENDPMLDGRDPRQLVNELLERWGTKRN